MLVGVRSIGLVPTGVLGPASLMSGWLTIVSMAALGLGVDLRVVAKAGVRVTAVVTLSLVVLALIAMALIRLLGFA